MNDSRIQQSPANLRTSSIKDLDPQSNPDIYKEASLSDLIKMSVPHTTTATQ